VNELEGRILDLTRQYLDPALAAGEFDWIGEFAGKLPMDVISELMGVPEADRVELRRLADLVVHREEGVLDVPHAAMEASLYLVGYYADMLAERRRKPTEDLTSALLEAEIDGDRLTDDEIIAFMFLMVVAGNETTTKLLGNALYWGFRYPGQARNVFEDASRVPEWVEETLRFDTSSQMVARTASVDLDFHDRTIPAGDKVLILIGSANRDSAVFEDADEYRIGRDTSNKLASFGGGTHFCLGAHMARLEARIALTELVSRIDDYDIDEANSVRVHSTNVRGFATLPMKVQVRDA
jgi:cytochrome P450